MDVLIVFDGQLDLRANVLGAISRETAEFCWRRRP